MKPVKNLSFLTLMLMLLISSGCTTVSPQLGRGQADLKTASKINVQLASGYIQRGDLKIAEEKLTKAIKQDPKNVTAYTTMALLQEIIDEPVEAENYYLQALDIDDKNPELHNNYGAFLCKQGKIDEAIKELQAAAKNQFYTTPEKAYANMGYCMMKAEKPDYKLAEKYLRLALKKNPNLKSALIAMGELGVKTHRYLMARAYMQRYHAIAPKSANSLWLQLQAERALGDQKHFIQLARLLLKKFPDSDEAQKVQELATQ